MFATSPFGVAVAEPSGVISEANEAFCRLVGRSEDDVLGQNLAQFAFPEDLDIVARILSNPEYPLEMRMVHPNATVVWVRVSATPLDASHEIVQFEDITFRKRDAERLSFLALHDALTGLPNRALVKDRIGTALEHAKGNEWSVAVLICDVDRFAALNNSLGNRYGDQLLVAVADRLEQLVRGGDAVSRLSADEFGVLAVGLSSPQDAEALAKRMSDAFSDPLVVEDEKFSVSLSVGIATGEPGLNPSDLLRRADIALQRARKEGGDGWIVFSEEIKSDVSRLVETEQDLRRALEHGELLLHYQPVVRLSDGKITGAEALVRWQHPEHGLLYPVSFIPLSEQTGQVVPLGAWVLDEAAKQVAQWIDAELIPEDFMVAINVSGRQLSDASFPGEVMKALDSSRFPASSLCLEVTESVLVEDTGSTARAVRELEGTGVKFAVDDFGTGYSALVNLKRFAFDMLKIDRSFVDGLGIEASDSAIVKAVVGVADALGLVCIAEGVEQDSQVAALRALGVDLVQGFFFSPPVNAQNFEQLLSGPVPWRRR